MAKEANDGWLAQKSVHGTNTNDGYLWTNDARWAGAEPVGIPAAKRIMLVT